MISVIMASYLGDYPRAATNREQKLHRAIQSFLKQNIGELIVVSDGCEKTIEIVNTYPSIKLISLPKQPFFSGNVRQEGINAASYDWICYLDSDDEFKDDHLQTILSNIDEEVDWMFYDDIVGGLYRSCDVGFARIGTSCIVHKKNLPVKWPDGYNHDWGFIQQLGNKYKKIHNAGYIVHHIPGRIDN